jgi:hypothetical protein
MSIPVTSIPFTLHPFATTPWTATLAIAGALTRSAEALILEYSLQGDLATVALPSRTSMPTRQFGLWEQTCFEGFFGETGGDRYWEINLAPTGDWNLFHLDRYRQGLREESACTALPVTVQSNLQTWQLTATLNLAGLIAPTARLEMSMTAVVVSATGEVSYWAVAHTGPEADFHRRDSFILSL